MFDAKGGDGVRRANKWLWSSKTQLEKIRSWVKAGKTDKEIAELIGVHVVTLSRWRQTDKRFYDALYKQSKSGQDIRDDIKESCMSMRKYDVQSFADAVRAYVQARRREHMPLTVPGMCVALGITQQTWSDYLNDVIDNKRQDIKSPITGESMYCSLKELCAHIKLAIESSLLDKAINSNSRGAELVLKSHYGYSDRQKIESNDKEIVLKWSKDDG